MTPRDAELRYDTLTNPIEPEQATEELRGA
jgi:hypothetical protein